MGHRFNRKGGAGAKLDQNCLMRPGRTDRGAKRTRIALAGSLAQPMLKAGSDSIWCSGRRGGFARSYAQVHLRAGHGHDHGGGLRHLCGNRHLCPVARRTEHYQCRNHRRLAGRPLKFVVASESRTSVLRFSIDPEEPAQVYARLRGKGWNFESSPPPLAKRCFFGRSTGEGYGRRACLTGHQVQLTPPPACNALQLSTEHEIPR